MKRHAPLLLCTLALSVGVACAQDEPKPREDPQDEPADAPAVEVDEEQALAGVEFFPLDVGRRWYYRVKFSILPVDGGAKDANEDADEAAGDHYLDVYVAEPVMLKGVRVAALEWKLDQALAQRSYFRVEADNLLCYRRLQGASESVKDFTLIPPQPTVPRKLAVGQEWSWEGTSGPSAGTQTFKVVRKEALNLPAGKFEALVVESTFTGEDDSRGTTTRWLVKDVGLVKEISEVRTPKQVFRSEGVLVKFEKP
jgi:hypothetical protein